MLVTAQTHRPERSRIEDGDIQVDKTGHKYAYSSLNLRPVKKREKEKTRKKNKRISLSRVSVCPSLLFLHFSFTDRERDDERIKSTVCKQRTDWGRAGCHSSVRVCARTRVCVIRVRHDMKVDGSSKQAR